MTHLPVLIQDLGLILMAAAVITIIFKSLNQPVVLGYLIAGFLVGPHFGLLPTVKDQASISIWAEIGVIFMLFGLGLEFSFKKLKNVGKSAGITAAVEILFMFSCGYLLGQAFGWSKIDSLFLGGIVSISSTAIIFRVFEELNLKGRSFVSLVFGILIVEDLIAVLLLVLLTSVAVTQTLSGSELVFTALRLVFFLIIWFLLGIYILPVLIKKYKNSLSDETMLVVSIGLCLMMVIVASQVGFSPALGAFVMGSILAETPKGRRIEHLIVPVKDLFSAIFFVSVGMLINPQIIYDHFGVIIIISATIIFGKFFGVLCGSLLSGRNLKNSVQSGLSLAQIGEFSFIIATLGITLKVTSDFLYPVAVAVSALTSFATPYLIRFSEPFYNWLDKKTPSSIRNLLSRYEVAMSTNTDVNVLSLIWHEYGIKVVLNSTVVVAITLAMSQLLLPKFDENIINKTFFQISMCISTMLLSGPFLWAVVAHKFVKKNVYKEHLLEQLKKLQIGVVVGRFIIGCLLIAFIIVQFVSVLAFSAVLVIAIFATAGLFFSRLSDPIYKKIEKRFLENINQNEDKNNTQVSKELAPWDATLVELTVSPFSQLAIKTLESAGLKETYGVTVAMIERGNKRILAPTRNEQLLPADKLFVIGSDDSIVKLKDIIEFQINDETVNSTEFFGLTSITLLPTDSFINKSIRDCGLRETVSGLVVGLERDGKRYLNPDSTMILLPNDLVWLVGDTSLIKGLRVVKKS